MAVAKKTTKTKKTEDESVEQEEKETIKEAEETKEKKPEPKSAKAGKRSSKAITEAQEKEAKEERKKTKTTKKAEDEKVKLAQKPPRSRIDRSGKKYREAYNQIDKSKLYNLAEAVELATKTSVTKFDATVELHINLEVDPKQADQNVRDTVALPNGTGKSARVSVFAEGDDIEKAKKAGADFAGSDDLLAKLDKEEIDFDVLISTPSMMARLGKYAKLLGPKGLMPNPKSGTVAADVTKAVKEAKSGRVEYRVDQAGIIHLGVGKVSFGPQKLLENAQAVVTSVKAAKPATVKGVYIKSTFLSSTMGPSVRVEL